MATIGLLGGGESGAAARYLEEVYANANKSLNYFRFDDNADYVSQAPDILIINSDKALLRKLKSINFSNSIVVANANYRNIFNLIRSAGRNIHYKLITYGFNSKSCVTASSITHYEAPDGMCEKLLCCIQRSIPTISGELLEEQEFMIETDGGNPHVDTVLAIVTAALVDGVGINELSNTRF